MALSKQQAEQYAQGVRDYAARERAREEGRG